MVKRVFFVTALLLLLISGSISANIIPHPELNIPYLCTFGNECSTDWGDDDFTNVIFLQVPSSTTDSLFLRVYDPDVGGDVDEINEIWDTETEFSLYGGEGAYTHPDARKLDPVGNYRSGTRIFSRKFTQDPSSDDRWVSIGSFSPDQGESLDDVYVFKVIVQGLRGDDGNMYRLALSTDRFVNIFPEGMSSFAFEWGFRLPNNPGEVVYVCPFEVPQGTVTISQHIWDFDNDNVMFLQTPYHTLPAYTGGNREWTNTKYIFSDGLVNIESTGKRWDTTTYEISDEERKGLWCFTVVKGSFKNNDVVFYVNSDTGEPIALASIKPPVIRQKIEEDSVDRIVVGDCNTIIVDASRSHDPNKDILSFEWNFGDGTITEGVRVVHRYENPGVYTISLTAYDHSGVPCDVGFKAIETIVNDPPVADAGPGQSASQDQEVAFDGTGSHDNDGSIIQYKWNFGDGSVSSGFAPVHKYEKPGTYRVKLTVIDDSKSSCDRDQDEMVVTINERPNAKLGGDMVICDLTVSFDASSSSDNDGFIDVYIWDFGDGTKGIGEQVTHTYQGSGEYLATLTVRDNSGMSDAYDTATMKVIINGRPVADAGGQKFRIVCVDEKIIFDGSASYDPEGFPLEYEWNLGDGSETNNRVRVEHVYPQPGEYLATLKVTDKSSSICNTDYDSVKVKVFQAPDATGATLGPRRVCVGDTVRFDGSTSSWYTPISYNWYFGDNTQPVNGNTVEHVFDSPGIYNVELTVMDNSGSNCNRSQDVIVIVVNYPPYAQAGIDKRGAVGDEIVFKDAGSRDIDGKVAAYRWDFGDNSNAEGRQTVHSFDKPGMYPVVLTVEDDSGLHCSMDTDTIYVKINFPPIADPGPDELICLGKVRFSGENSKDTDGQIIEYIWDFGDETTGRGRDPYHIYKESGSYTATLTVKDNSGTRNNTDSGSKILRINTPPKAIITGSGLIRPEESYSFDGSKSYDPDGDAIISYEWDFGDESTGSGEIVQHTYKEPGSYLISLTVKDDTGVECNIGVDNTLIVVNAPPVAKAGVYDGNIFCTADQIVFDGSASFDPDGKKLEYVWDFGDGDSGTGVHVTHRYTNPGRYDIVLEVTDDAINAEMTDSDIIVVIVNDPPAADAGPDIVTCSPTVSLDGTKSSDPDGTISIYAWDFGDKSGEDHGAKPTHTFPTPGAYTVTLTVTDDSGTCSAKDSDALIVHINYPPLADAGGNRKGCPGQELKFDGGKSSDRDGKIIAYHWDFGDGGEADGKKVAHTYEKSGKYTAKLTVTDDSNSECDKNTDAITIFVNMPPIANAGPDQKICIKSANCEVHFDGSNSNDPDGGIITFEWDFGDGSMGTGMRPSHIYHTPGSFTVTLTVKDDSGTECVTAKDSLTIEANEQPVPIIDVESAN